MLENRIARYYSRTAANNSIAPPLSHQGQAKPAPRASAGNWPIMSRADLYRLAFEQAREEAQRKYWSNNRIRQYFE